MVREEGYEKEKKKVRERERKKEDKLGIKRIYVRRREMWKKLVVRIRVRQDLNK